MKFLKGLIAFSEVITNFYALIEDSRNSTPGDSACRTFSFSGPDGRYGRFIPNLEKELATWHTMIRRALEQTGKALIGDLVIYDMKQRGEICELSFEADLSDIPDGTGKTAAFGKCRVSFYADYLITQLEERFPVSSGSTTEIQETVGLEESR